MAFSKRVRGWLPLLIGSLALAAPVGAVQFVLAGDERINQFGSGLPGTPYNTAPGGVDYDQIGSGDPHPGEVHLVGTVPQLNYHTTGAPGVNNNVAFAQPLVFTLEAELLTATLTPAGGTFVTLTLEFGGTNDGAFDLVVTDPSDSTTLLEANLASGTLNGNPVEAITAQATFDCGVALPGPCVGVAENVNMQTFAFFQAVSGPYASLFDDGLGGLDAALAPGLVNNFDVGDVDANFDWNDIVAAFDGTPGSLISNTAQASGSIFSVSGSNFQVPEPSLAGLLAGGVLLAFARRTRKLG